MDNAPVHAELSATPFFHGVGFQRVASSRLHIEKGKPHASHDQPIHQRPKRHAQRRRHQPGLRSEHRAGAARLEHGDAAILAEVVAVAKAAQPAWAAINPQRRTRVLFKFKASIEEHRQELVRLMSSEHGKLLDDSNGELQRGLNVVEFVCGVPHLQKGEFTQGVGPGINVYSIREPLGVVAGITPFNFPAMIPLWMLAPAIAVGNAFILKPSERTPSVAVRLAELALEAGVPPGILNVVHGGKDVGQAITDHPDIKAVSFIGSTAVGKFVYARGAGNGKRMQCMGGAKNHGVILPDADLDQVVADVLAGAFGSAGERCMSMPVIVPVGQKTADAIRERRAGPELAGP
jgi:malonate-semialdehyde dehydrogenase (acetylating)/methylmalonate-semialdehyde dehydrogenase